MNPALPAIGLFLAAAVAVGAAALIEQLLARRQIRAAKKHARRRRGYIDTPTGERRLP